MKKKTLFDKSNFLVKVRATISGALRSDYNIILAVDSGSFSTVIRPEILEKVGIPHTEFERNLIGTTGDTSAKIAIVPSLTVFGITTYHHSVAAHAIPDGFEVDGLLGNDFFRYYKLCIDYPNGIIEIEQP